jgi:hypothetical protein
MRAADATKMRDDRGINDQLLMATMRMEDTILVLYGEQHKEKGAR